MTTDDTSSEPRRSRLAPHTFQALPVLRALNVAAVGLALSAATGAAFARGLFGDECAPSIALPTLACGVVWAALLRVRATVGRSPIRWGWLASVPLAATNAAIACGLVFGRLGATDEFLLGAIFGATVGALFWVPALLATLAAFGLPIFYAQRLAERGLSGEERGERIVGVTAALVSLAALVVTFSADARAPTDSGAAAMGGALLVGLGASGLLSGGAAAALASRRDRRRRAFLADVEAGAIAGYRVETKPEGRALVRVTPYGEAYRVVNFEEVLYEEGAATPPPARAASARR